MPIILPTIIYLMWKFHFRRHSGIEGCLLFILSSFLNTVFKYLHQFSSVQSLSRVRLFETPWIAAGQASLSITISRSSLRLTSMSQWCHPAISSSVNQGKKNICWTHKSVIFWQENQLKTWINLCDTGQLISLTLSFLFCKVGLTHSLNKSLRL